MNIFSLKHLHCKCSNNNFKYDKPFIIDETIPKFQNSSLIYYHENDYKSSGDQYIK